MLNSTPKLIWLLVAVMLMLTGCKKFDSLMPDPQVRPINQDQAELLLAFGALTDGDLGACSVISSPQEIPDVLRRILTGSRAGSEIVFLVDKTSSMEDDIDEVKKSINTIIDCIPEGCRLGAAAYGDNRVDGPEWYVSSDLDEDYAIGRQFINSIAVSGGGDYPESVYDAIWKVLDEMSWKDCSAPDRIIVMGDAPPRTGSGTDHTLEEVLAKAKSICPNTEFYPVIVIDL